MRIVMAEGGTGMLLFTTGDFVYLNRGAIEGLAVGQRYMVVRSVKDPDPNKSYSGQNMGKLGYIYSDIGQVEINAVFPTQAVARVAFACDPLMAGDFVIPFENRPLPAYKGATTVDPFPSPSGMSQGTVVAMKDFSILGGLGNAIYINLGENDGISNGAYLILYRDGTGTRFRGTRPNTTGIIRSYRGMGPDGKIPSPPDELPREILGEAFVVRTEGKSSTAVITASRREIHAGDYVELRPFPEPEISLTVAPVSVERGRIGTLSWNTRFADSIELTPAPGSVEPKGSLNVVPADTTTYTLVARGRGGVRQVTVTLEVTEPPPPPPVAPLEAEEEAFELEEAGVEITPLTPVVSPALVDLFAEAVQDIFFDFDKSEITETSAVTLQRAAQFLIDHPEVRVLIEGHADEIFTEEYNLELGQRRAEATLAYVVALGVPPEQFDIISIGESLPFCTESAGETCRQLNRRGHFVLLNPIAAPEPEAPPQPMTPPKTETPSELPPEPETQP